MAPGLSRAYTAEFKPLAIKNLCLQCDISQGDIARGLNISRPLVNLIINKGYLPPTHPNIRAQVETFLLQPESGAAVNEWLAAQGMKLSEIWNASGDQLRNSYTTKHGNRIIAGKNKQAFITGVPEQILCREVVMLNAATMKHFKIFRHPFINDINQSTDIFKSEDHMFIEASMLDAAKNGGFLAVIGEVGSGKSTIRREVMVALKRESKILVVFPQIVDKGRVNAGSICDAIIMDLSEEKPKIKQEHKTRQVTRLLQARRSAGYHVCLFLEEAHDLTTTALKHLKRIYEFEDGYNKLMSIVLIGQPELKQTLSEDQHPEMREVIRRIQKAEILGLNGDLRSYLALKFKRVGADISKIMTDEAIVALSKKLHTTGPGGKKVSHAFPLLVNNLVAEAMNEAVEMGYELVNETVVESL